MRMNETVVTLKRSPFKPGSGLSPPTLAGRAKEQSLLQRHLDDLAAGEGAACQQEIKMSTFQDSKMSPGG